ncbi:MAG: TonB family protein [Paucibacter sp.]|nr:TonB family protein [Roseateles sp.]
MNYGPTPQQTARRLQGFAFVVALHAMLVWALASGLARKALDAVRGPVEMAVVEEKTPPPPPPPPPPTPDVKMPAIELPINLPPPPLNVETPPPPPPPAPVVTAPAPKDLTAVNVAPRAPAPPAEQSEAQKIASMEGAYVVQVRGMLNSTKRYPTGRQASQQRPKGKVKVWFTLARDGKLLESGILESSDNNLLDDAALSTVRRGVYPAFPPHTWTGLEQQKFTAELEFTPPG